MIKAKRILKCRVCNNKDLVPCIDIGKQYLSSIFPKNKNYKKNQSKYPLSLVLCKKRNNTCGTLQLEYFIDLTEMYTNYPYLSATNSSMKLLLEDIAKSSLKHIELTKDDTILDIGGNDGTLLSNLTKTKASMLTIDPAKNIKQEFSYKKFKYVNDYFSKKTYDNSTDKKSKLIFSIAMFYHLSNPVEFSKDVEKCLDENGIWIIQMAYLPSMLKTNMYDNIVHEHAGYYSLNTMKWIMERVGLEIFDCELNDVYGGSFRIFIKKKNNKSIRVNKRVAKILSDEEKIGIYKLSTYRNFMKSISKTKADLLTLLTKLKKSNKSIWVYGASTKGNTILQFCGIDTKFITAAADSNPFKFNKIMIGSEIPIFDEEKMRKSKPDYLLSLPYSFTYAFVERERKLIKSGTKFIVPLPRVKIIPK